MQNLLVVGGAFDFSGDFPEFNVIARPLQNAKWWLDQNNHLFWLEPRGATRVDGVLWRVGAIRPHEQHRHALELIRLAGVPCVNAAQTLLRGFDRLSMLAELRAAGLPGVPFQCVLGEGSVEQLAPDLPCVLKIGNWHGGLGKARLTSRDTWEDARDLAATSTEYATIEPFVDYRRDMRVLVVGARMWAMARRSSAWKVNRGLSEFEIMAVPDAIGAWTQRLQRHLGAEMLGVDWIETRDGEWLCLESNDVPGLTGWPDEVRRALCACVRVKMSPGLST